ncbi:hypothetical protein PR048_001680 [Dryococelus australis]|uniref:Uncharacterized protein n=1 Tax=Dryococelus australis TaxID=614101 RepID=A0ABQ9II72_9NEOP|nr:hypothetical protein PR048_001680 [Dryococelus australis]
MKLKVKAALKDKLVVIVEDETAESKVRCIFAILFRTLNTKTAEQEPAAHSWIQQMDCSQAIIDGIKKYDVEYNNILGVVSDSAQYGKMFPSITNHCWGSPAPFSVFCTKTELRELSFPSFHPVSCTSDTSWNLWFEAVQYLNKYVDVLVDFFKNKIEEESNSSSSASVISMFQDKQSAAQLKVEIVFLSKVSEKILELINTPEESNYTFGHKLWDELKAASSTLESLVNACTNVVTKEKIKELRECMKKCSAGVQNMSGCANEVRGKLRAAAFTYEPALFGARGRRHPFFPRRLEGEYFHGIFPLLRTTPGAFGCTRLSNAWLPFPQQHNAKCKYTAIFDAGCGE